jgi:heparin/heparan-sulfate lyase
LDCLLNANKVKARDIISITWKIVANMTTPFISENESVSDKINRDLSKGFSARFGGHVLFVASLVYDWLYPYFADEEKNRFIESCEKLAAATQEIGYPPGVSDRNAADCTSPFAGHSNEAGLLRDLLAFGIATYDERPDIYNYCAGKLFDEFVPAYEFQFQGSFHHQGSAYGCYRYTWLLWTQLLFKSMCGKNIFSKKVEDVADSFYYLLRSDGEVL